MIMTCLIVFFLCELIESIDNASYRESEQRERHHEELLNRLEEEHEEWLDTVREVKRINFFDSLRARHTSHTTTKRHTVQDSYGNTYIEEYIDENDDEMLLLE